MCKVSTECGARSEGRASSSSFDGLKLVAKFAPIGVESRVRNGRIALEAQTNHREVLIGEALPSAGDLLRRCIDAGGTLSRPERNRQGGLGEYGRHYGGLGHHRRSRR
jgi:hypothetical protein